jgi:hypothetical protein
MKLTPDEARDIVYESHEDWSKVRNTEELTDQTRWSVCYTAVFKNNLTGKFYRFNWSCGATEQQDEQAYEYDTEVEVNEVVEKEILVKQWVNV